MDAPHSSSRSQKRDTSATATGNLRDWVRGFDNTHKLSLRVFLVWGSLLFSGRVMHGYAYAAYAGGFPPRPPFPMPMGMGMGMGMSGGMHSSYGMVMPPVPMGWPMGMQAVGMTSPAIAPPSYAPAPDPSEGLTTLFVGGVDVRGASEHDIFAVLSQAGAVSGIRVPEGKGCAFVTFQTRAAAEKAKETLQGAQVGLYRIRLEWGRSGPAGAGGARPHMGMASGSAAAAPNQHFGPGSGIEADSAPPGVPFEAIRATCRPADTGVPPAGHPSLRFFAAQAQAQALVLPASGEAADPLQRPLELPGFVIPATPTSAVSAVVRLPASALAQRAAMREAAATAGGRVGAGDAGDDIPARNRIFGATQSAVQFADQLASGPFTVFTSSGAQPFEGTVMASL